MFRKFSNDTQENSKDAQKREEALKEVQEENTALNRERNDLTTDKDNLTKANTDLKTEKESLTKANTELKTEKENLNNQLNASQKQVKELEHQ
ncbi:hypothetical protein KVE17_00305 [Helicobacter pylori]|uniref:hypothetical protein n=1 Tax=Helicobacter pylori TaxID=210 RepID=UPI0012FEB472|nr:hypothetical protein [Helicobacter pylori]WRE47523.1 hypothetical protein KVE17_00305 [Helicobacter pylori]